MANEYYQTHPYIVKDSITGRGLQFKFKALRAGKMWSMIVKYKDRVKYVDGSSIIKLQGRALSQEISRIGSESDRLN